jgi:Ca2+-binding EF-hand superfamily protein
MALDANGDGAITRAEARDGRQAMFDRMDTDRNGYLSESERAGARGDRATRQGLGDADSNNDGQVSRAEAMAAPYRGFDRLDANNDDVVSSQELEAVRTRLGG